MLCNTKYVLIVVFSVCVFVCVYMQLFVLILGGIGTLGIMGFLGLKGRLAKLPSVAALIAHDKRGHRFISGARL